MNIRVLNGELTPEQIVAYEKYAKEKYPYETIEELVIDIQGDEVELKYVFVPYKMERIRRITGYLVGTVDRWNDAKQAELRDRVKHA